MKNLVASKRRVRSIIKQFEAAGYMVPSWTEDGPHDSPKLEINADDGGGMLDGAKQPCDGILVAVETDSIHVTPWGPGCEVAYVEFKDVAAFLSK